MVITSAQCLGQAKPTASRPNFDRLVKNGTAFTNAHIMGGLSGAICMPSRAMLMTGRTLFRVDRQPTGDDSSFDILHTSLTLPEYLRKNGYQPAGIGKQHNGKGIYARAFTDGAKVMFGGMSDQYNIPHYDFSKEGSYKNFDWNGPLVSPGAVCLFNLTASVQDFIKYTLQGFTCVKWKAPYFSTLVV